MYVYFHWHLTSGCNELPYHWKKTWCIVDPPWSVSWPPSTSRSRSLQWSRPVVCETALCSYGSTVQCVLQRVSLSLRGPVTRPVRISGLSSTVFWYLSMKPRSLAPISFKKQCLFLYNIYWFSLHQQLKTITIHNFQFKHFEAMSIKMQQP